MTSIAVNEPSAPGGKLLLWSSAALAALALHGGLAAWILRAPPILPAETNAPVAVMIELAAAPSAPEESEPVIAPDATDAPEVTPPPQDLPPPPDLAELPSPPAVEPPPSLAAPELPPTSETMPAIEPQPPLPSEIAIARPMARPKTLPPPEQAEAKPVREPPSKAATRGGAQAPPARIASAAQIGSGASGAASPAKWQTRLMAQLERHKRYPATARQRREEGVAYVRFAIDGEGRVLSASIARSSGSTELDQEVLALVRRASPVPAPPPGASHDITAPVQFRIR